jgi:hypothetical protein
MCIYRKWFMVMREINRVRHKCVYIYVSVYTEMWFRDMRDVKMVYMYMCIIYIHIHMHTDIYINTHRLPAWPKSNIIYIYIYIYIYI